MPNPYLATQLLQDLKDAGTIPPSDSNSTTRLLGFINREQRTYLMKLLLEVREEYRVATEDVDIEDGTLRYPIPTRATGANFKMLALVTDSRTRILHPIKLEDQERAGLVGAGGDFYFENNEVVLTTQLTGTLRFHFYKRLNRIVEAEDTGAITAINTGTRQVTIGATPDGWVTTSTAYDFIQGTPHFDTLAGDRYATRASNVLTFAVALPDRLAVGDYVALAGETPICQAPVELHDVLIERALVKYFSAKKDAEAVKLARENLKEMREDALAILAPRATATLPVIRNLDGPGWRRGGVHRRAR